MYLECNGNSFTRLMHLIVFRELNLMRAKGLGIKAIIPEKEVMLEKNGRERRGKFDFLVEADCKRIGVEVLTRPSQGKMKEKLAYAREVDEFVFALPQDSMGLYRRRQKNGIKRVVPKKFLEKGFRDKSIKAWLVDCRHGLVSEKGEMGELFEVAK